MSDNQPSSFIPPTADNAASRPKRLGAAIIDAFIMGFVLLLVMQQTGLADVFVEYMKLPPEQRAGHEIESWWFGFKMALLQFVLFTMLQGYFLYQFGQTIGKFVLGIAIVTMDNQKPEFMNLLINRYLSQWLMGVIPVVGVLLRLVDILLIFRDDKRCLHDMIAKTRVIDLSIPVSTQHPTSIIV